MNRKAILAKALFLAAACLASNAVSLRAATFTYNPQDLVLAFRQSGYLERITHERREKNPGASASYA